MTDVKALMNLPVLTPGVWEMAKIFNLKRLVILLSVVIIPLTGLPAYSNSLVVSQRTREYSSIQRAIDQASPGATILVKKGAYEENLAIDKDLVLRGVDVSKVEIRGKNRGRPVVLVGPSAAEVKIKDLTIRGAEGGECLKRREGVCSLGLSATGNSEVAVDDALFVGNRYGGIGLFDLAQATVRNSEIKKNGSGTLLNSSTLITLMSAEILRNKNEGLKLSDSARATVKDSKIRENGTGIELSDSSQAVLRSCRILGNTWGGVGLSHFARVVLEKSEIMENGVSGLRVSDSGNATVERTILRENAVGLANYSKNKLELQKAEVVNNLINFVGNVDGDLRNKSIKGEQKKILWPAKDYASLQGAIDALEEGGTIVLDGEVKGGAIIDKKVTIEAAGEKASLLSSGGVRVPVLSLINGADLLLNGVEVVDSGGRGIILGGDAEIKVQKGAVTGSRGYGIGLYNSARAVLEDSEISGNKWDGVEMWHSTRVTLSNSHIRRNGTGLGLYDSARVTVIDGDIRRNGDGIGLYNSARAVLEDSEISGNKWSGIGLSDAARATVKDSYIGRNGTGLELWHSARATIRGSRVEGNSSIGIKLDDAARINIEDSYVRENGTGIKIGEAGQFEGILEGFNNEILENEVNFKGVSPSVREKLTSDFK